MKRSNERYAEELRELQAQYEMTLRAEERMQFKVNSTESTSTILQTELEAARERFDRAEDDTRELIKRNTQLEIDIKSKSMIAQRAEEALIKAKDELSFNQDIRTKLDEAKSAKEEAEKLRTEAREETSLLQDLKTDLVEREKTIKTKDDELDRLRKRLESQEKEMKRSVEEALRLAQEERELAEIARKAAEADRVAAKADRQVAQRELIASTRKTTGSYTLDSIREGLTSSDLPEDQMTLPPQQPEPPQSEVQALMETEAQQSIKPETWDKPITEGQNADVAQSKPTPSIEVAQAAQGVSANVAKPTPAISNRESMNIPRRGPRDPRGGAKQLARFGALEIPLRRCPEGIGRIGSESHEGRAEEKPIHNIKFANSFWMSETPITQLQWMAVMRSNPSQFTDPYRPVDGVSWLDAARFCNRMSTAYQFTPVYEIVEGNEAPVVYWREDANGFRLPTEAEWEYAARANTSEINQLYTGHELDRVAWYRDNSGGETRPVGMKAPNDWGFVDCCGNVWEWCHDEWTRSAYQERSNQSQDKSQSSVTHMIWDPVTYRSDLRHKVARGGSFADSTTNCRIACRGRLEVFGRRYSVGLRICLPYDLTL
jgi:formylglycine-generating enzyme required for sulfatase activity